MEYTSTTNNWAFVTHFPELDIKDAVIVDFLSRYAQSPHLQKKVFSGKVYYWFNYDKIAEELPLLKIGERRVRERFLEIIKAGILEAHPENAGGKTFFAFGPRYPLTHARAVSEPLAEKGQGFGETSAENRQGLVKPRRKIAKGLAENRQGLDETSAENRQHISIPLSDIPLSVPPTTEVEENAQARKTSLPSEIETSDLREEIPPTPPSSAAPPAPPAPGGWKPFDIVAEGEAIKTAPNIPILFAREAKITSADEAAARLPKAVDVFVQEQIALSSQYNNTREFRRHFINWVGRVTERGSTSTTAKPQYSKSATATAPSKVVFGKPDHNNVSSKVCFFS